MDLLPAGWVQGCAGAPPDQCVRSPPHLWPTGFSSRAGESASEQASCSHLRAVPAQIPPHPGNLSPWRVVLRALPHKCVSLDSLTLKCTHRGTGGPELTWVLNQKQTLYLTITPHTAPNVECCSQLEFDFSKTHLPTCSGSGDSPVYPSGHSGKTPPAGGHHGCDQTSSLTLS